MGHAGNGSRTRTRRGKDVQDGGSNRKLAGKTAAIGALAPVLLALFCNDFFPA